MIHYRQLKKTLQTLKTERKHIMTSKHFTQDRTDRERRIREIGYGEKVASFVVDRGHKNGPEIHEITSTGIINIYNQFTKKLVTKLIARPAQIKRYFKGNAPKELLAVAKYNTYTLGYNY